MIITRQPLVPPLGGGIPFGGTRHAGHAEWMEVMNPRAAAPEKFTMPQPSLYATPTPRELPSIVAKPFKLLRGMGRKIGGALDDGYSRVAPVGEESAAMQLMNADTNMSIYKPPPVFYSGFREAPIGSEATSIRAKTESTQSKSGGMDQDMESPVKETMAGLEQLDFGLETMEKLHEDVGGNLSSPGLVEQSMEIITSPPPATTETFDQEMAKSSQSSPRMNASENTFNVNPLTTHDELQDSLKINTRRVPKNTRYESQTIHSPISEASSFIQPVSKKQVVDLGNFAFNAPATINLYNDILHLQQAPVFKGMESDYVRIPPEMYSKWPAPVREIMVGMYHENGEAVMHKHRFNELIDLLNRSAAEVKGRPVATKMPFIEKLHRGHYRGVQKTRRGRNKK